MINTARKLAAAIKTPEPVFINGYWRAVMNGCIQPQPYNTHSEAAANCK